MLSNRSFVRGFIAGTILALSILAAAAESPAMTASKTGYAPVNGLNLYYEIYGAGEPLVLLHGGAGAIEIFSSIMPDLSRNHQVIAVDLQAHGRTAPPCSSLGMRTPSGLRMLWSSSNSSAAGKEMAVGTDQECPTLGLRSYRTQRITPSSRRLR
jgi:alpha-beta hydrolase superfamily lysophospholipase